MLEAIRPCETDSLGGWNDLLYNGRERVGRKRVGRGRLGSSGGHEPKRERDTRETCRTNMSSRSGADDRHA